MTKYFGTDGIRGRANDKLTNFIAYRVGLFLGQYCRINKKGRICIGKDTRISSSMFENIIAGAISASGSDVFLVGYCSTPALAYICSNDDFDFGVMISASHNPYADNGIKIFSNNGIKMSEELENQIEDFLDNKLTIDEVFDDKIGRIYEYKEGLKHYIDWIKKLYPLNLSSYKLLVDCANGSNSYIAYDVLKDLGCNVSVINNNPNGININKDCGSTHLDNLKKEIVEGDYDFGLAFDGDADRVLFVNNKGETIDGDIILYILASHFQIKNKLRDNTVVATVMSNIGLYKALSKKGINVLSTSVGDKNVLDEMIKGSYNLGGEQSGHIIILSDSYFGDGLKTLLALLEALIEDNKTIDVYKKEIDIFPQLLLNIRVRDKDVVLKDKEICSLIDSISNELKDDGRIFVRPSGTEPLIRVMAEARDDATCQKYVTEVIDLIRSKGYEDSD